MQTNNDSLSVINEKYKGCNLLMPMSVSEQMSPFYKMTVMEVKADLSENSGDVFKVGSVKDKNENWVEVFSPAKPLLMKIAAAAGIQFDPAHTGGEYVNGDKNVYRGRAYGAMKMPDGTWKTHADEKIINLHDSEDNYRLEFMDKSLKGITDKRQAEAASEMFAGEWKPAKNKYGKEVKAFFVAEQDREQYIERGVMVNMTLLRKTMCEKALTGAILRTVRALTGLKGTYTKEELAKPFAIPRVTFSPDYSDPQIRSALLNQEIGSTAALFGSAPAAAAPVLRDNLPTAPEKAFNVDAFAENPAFASDQEEDASDPPEAPKPAPAKTQAMKAQRQENPEDNYVCEVCGAIISAKVYDYSVEHYGRPLCVKCQREVREE